MYLVGWRYGVTLFCRAVLSFGEVMFSGRRIMIIKIRLACLVYRG